MSLEKIFDFIVNTVRKEEQRKQEDAAPFKAKKLCEFKAERKARQLILPAQELAIHHREREKHYTTALEEAEKDFKENGVTVEVYDPKTGMSVSAEHAGAVSSGAIQGGNISYGNFTGGNMPKFQPRVNQDLLDKVERSKSKMLEHRNKAEQYEKYARAFACNPEMLIELTVEDIHYFLLEC